MALEREVDFLTVTERIPRLRAVMKSVQPAPSLCTFVAPRAAFWNTAMARCLRHWRQKAHIAASRVQR